MSNKLTEKQRRVLLTIDQYINMHGYSPSIRDVGQILNIHSSSTVYSYLERLKEKGYITWEPERPRTMQILKTVS